MNRNEFIQKYWSFYLTLEEDFIKTLRYVELNEDNYSTYSIEFAKQYQSICSEVDVLCKELAHLIDSSNPVRNISDYGKIILRQFPDIQLGQVKVNNGIQLVPWKGWQITPDYASPSWWSNYNKVKHSRTLYDNKGVIYYKKANLENVLYALSGLYILEMYTCKEVSKNHDEFVTVPTPKSNLFNLDGWEPSIIVPGSGDIIFQTE